MATPIHNHSHYSFPTGRDGLSKPEHIASRVKELGFEACAITDHDVVAGHVDFYKTMMDADIKPILGIEAYQATTHRSMNAGAQRDKESGARLDNYHLVMLAQSNQGLRNLWALNSESHRSGFWYHGRVDWELLAQYNEGIIATSACGISMLSWAIQHGNPDEVLQKYLKIFGDRFYIELHTYSEPWQKDLNIELVNLGRRYGVPFVYANDAHYSYPEQHDLHEAVISLALNAKFNDPCRISHTPDLYIMAEDDTSKRLNYLPKGIVSEAIANSDVIASQCNVTLPERRNRIPIFVPDKQWGTSKDMIFDLAVDGYMRKIRAFGKDDSLYMPRFEKEMKVIYDAGLVDYFLIVRDYIQNAKKQGIMVGPGRGSAGGSLIAYLLGITALDPIRYGLIFERFYNAGRETGLPDIDTDFPVHRREDVKKYIVDTYGADYVSDLATVGRMMPKMSINDMARVLSVPMMESKKITNILDNSITQGLQAKDWEEIYHGNEQFQGLAEELAPYEQKYPRLFDFAKQLHKQIRNYGVHPSGVIIGDEPLAQTFPLKWNAKQEKMVTQFDMDIAADLGFMKMDLLGLRNLDTLDEVNNILRKEGRELIDYDSLQYQEHDQGMWDMLADGLTVGIFQIESGGLAKQILRELKPQSVDELAVAVAMNRPGPIIAGALDKYTYGKSGGTVHYAHPFLEDITRDTFGVFLYQEQVINYMTSVGYNLFEADDVRSIMGKKKIDKVTAELDRYLPRAMEHMDKTTAMEIWEQLVNFSRYGFNKSHAVAYAIITLWTAYAKYHYPMEFFLAGIRTVDKDVAPLYVAEAQKMGIKVLPPSINGSGVQIDKDGDGIRYGFSNIKGFGAGPARWIVAHAPFYGIEDFLTKVQENKIDLPNGRKRVAVDVGKLEKLILLGAFGTEVEYDHKIKKDTCKHMEALQGNDLLELEEELLGVALSDESGTILEDHRAEIENTCVDFDMIDEAGEYTVAGIITEIRESKTKRGDKMAYVRIKNGPQELETAVWSNVLKRLDFIFRRRQAGIFHLKRDNQGRYSLLNAKALFKKDLSRSQSVTTEITR